MKKATAKLKYLRMSPRKVRLVADMIRGQRLEKAAETLAHADKKAARFLAGLLQSAAANAGQIEGMDTENLYVGVIKVDEGPTMKRFMPRAMGRASQILKRTSHVELILNELVAKESKEAVNDTQNDTQAQDVVEDVKQDDVKQEQSEDEQTHKEDKKEE